MFRMILCLLLVGISIGSFATLNGADPVKKAAVPPAKSAKDGPKAIPTVTDPVQSARLAEEAFSAALFHELARPAKPEIGKMASSSNLVVSPYGIYEALAMLRLGSGGGTRTALEKILGSSPDDMQLARAVSLLRSVGDPFVLQLGASVSDNDQYGVKVISSPPKDSLLAQAGIGEGDLIFSVDEQVVRKASELIQLCATSSGQVRLNGYDFRKGEIFTDKEVELTSVRQIASPPDQQMLNVANALLVDQRIKVNAAFRKQLETLYKAPTIVGDFGKAAILEAEASTHFSDATGGRQSKFRFPKQVSADTSLLLVNVLTMEAQWQRRFPPAKPGTFHAPEKDVAAQMMQQTAGYRLAEFKDLQVLELPYRDSSLAMWILLPTQADGWRKLDVAQLLAPESLSRIRGAMKLGKVELQLPKFRITRDESMKNVLATLGLSELFTSKANFSALTAANNILLEDVRQQVFIEVNEQGTRAGAVTQAIGAVKSLAPENLKHFHADHPFLFLIRDASGGIYFVGRVISPDAPVAAVQPKA